MSLTQTDSVDRPPLLGNSAPAAMFSQTQDFIRSCPFWFTFLYFWLIKHLFYLNSEGVASSTTYRGDTFTCKICGFHCIGIQAMIEHANEKHVDSNYKFNQCVLCKKQFRDCQYNYHLATHCRTALVCQFCFLYFEVCYLHTTFTRKGCRKITCCRPKTV